MMIIVLCCLLCQSVSQINADTLLSQTAFDAANYALGNTDTLKGTGVWAGAVDIKREPKEEESKKPAEKKTPSK